ncbi:VOC family protein [Amycolatopsis sp. NPDC051373]|uniref:VOC family protein n=1 Tax=Amycolatopsis sp. NPDC051373 TaxID=3155801 RepID=UPI00344BCE21
MSTFPALDGVHHHKYPVTDLARSLAWWERVFGAWRQPEWDHRTPDGVLFAYLLRVPGLAGPVELRLAPGSAAALAGFDPLTLAVADEAAVRAWARHFDALEVANSGVLRGITGWLVATADPDGVPIRLYSRASHEWDPEGADLGSSWTAPLPRDVPAR